MILYFEPQKEQRTQKDFTKEILKKPFVNLFCALLILNPTLTYSIKENWDVDFVGQLVFDKEETIGYRSPVQAIFLRFKFSF